MSESFDCIVIGGGPAGSTTAALVAEAGHRVLVLERARFPRHHIGESLMPQTYWSFKRLGLLEKMRKSSFVRKESVQFVSANGRESAPFYFTDRDPNEWSVTWQVKRDEFDAMMLDNAEDRGAEIRHNVKVREVLFQGDMAIGVRATLNGEDKDIWGRVIVDATGQSGLLSRQLGIRKPDPRLRQSAVYTHYRGGEVEEGRNAGATLILHTTDGNGWFWYIPLKNNPNLVSVGIVAPPSYLFSGHGDDPEATLDEEIANCHGIRRRLVSATRVGKVYVTADFSYHANQVAGDGWVLVGDAYGFIDPVYSSGVMLAMKSGEFAADAIHQALQANDVSAATLGSYEHRLMTGLQNIRSLVYAFYDKDFNIGRFVRDNPDYKDHIVRILIGDVFNKEVGEVFKFMPKSVDLTPPIDTTQSVSA